MSLNPLNIYQYMQCIFSACYGIVTVPTGPWYCRKCESGDTKTKVVKLL